MEEEKALRNPFGKLKGRKREDPKTSGSGNEVQNDG